MLSKKIKANIAVMLSLVISLTPTLTYADGVIGDNSKDGVIKGHVFKIGADKEHPEIIHKAINSLNSGIDIEIKASITDNISIIKSEIWVKNQENDKWTVVSMKRCSGDYKNGEYTGIIPGEVVKSPNIQYQVKAQDFGGNIVETPIYNVEVGFGEKPDMYETDFTQYPNGWQLTGEWAWGEPKQGPKPLVGKNLIGTNLSGNYKSNSDSMLIMPAVDLRNSKQASVRLKHWYDIERKYDKGIVSISNDYGKTWKTVKEYEGHKKQWQEMIIELNEYCGSENPVLIGFQLKSDKMKNYAGWYIDDVKFVGIDNEGPTAATELKVFAEAKKIVLNWTGIEDVDFSGYNVYRAKLGEDFQLIASTKDTEFIDKDYEKGKTYKYMIKATDLVKNESKPSNIETVTAPIMKIIYENDFETDIDVWKTGGKKNTWEHGGKSYYYHGPKTIPSGQYLWGTDLIREYAPDSKCWLETPEFDLSEYTMAELNYQQWIWTEANFDLGSVQVSKDKGKKWNEVARYDGEHNHWVENAISLNEYAGEKIKIRFLLISDDKANRPGWYIDDVKILASKEKYNNTSKNNNKARIDNINESYTNKLNEKIENKQDIRDKDSVPVNSKVDFKLLKEPNEYVVVDTNNKNTMTGLPVEATVTIEETGENTKVSLVDGSFKIKHKPSDKGEKFTVNVEAYGYYSEKEKIELPEGGEVVRDFLLEDIPKGKIVGKLVDERTREPIEGAKIKVLEDEHLDIGVTDSNGNFIISNVLEEKYTMRISHEKYHMQEETIQVVGNKDNDLTLRLRPFIGYNSEIAYDNGVEDETRALLESGNSWVVKMTPENLAVLKGAKFHVHGEDWPMPGNNKVSIIVFDSLPDGEPGEAVFETGIIEVKRGDWNYVDLSAYKFETDRDFYLGVTQIGKEPNCIGLSFDERGKFAKRTYQYFPKQDHVKFRHLGYEWGNAMIRADIAYLLKVPTVEYKEAKEFVNKEIINLSGTTSESNSSVKIYVNEKEVKEVQTKDRSYSVDVPLEEGQNIITVTGVIKAGETDKTEPIKVIKDTKAPKINIEEENKILVTNKDVISISGKVEDENLQEIIIRGKRVEFKEDGSFNERIILEQGENNITIKSLDKAGNQSNKTIKIKANLVDKNSEYPITITNMGIKRLSGRITIDSTIKNMKGHIKDSVMIVKVSDENNKVINISTVGISELLQGKSMKLSGGFNELNEGTYKVEAYVWDNLKDKNLLSDYEKTSFSIEKN